MASAALMLAILLLVLNGCGAASPVPATTSSPAATPGAIQKPTVPQPTRGGSLVIRAFTDNPPDLDPYLTVSFRAQVFAGYFSSRVLKFDNGPGIGANAFIPIGSNTSRLAA